MSDQTITCGQCGAANDPTATFCRECGALLAAYASPSGAQTGTESPPAPATPPPPAPATRPEPAPPARGLTWDDIESAAARDFETAARTADGAVVIPPAATPEPPTDVAAAPPDVAPPPPPEIAADQASPQPEEIAATAESAGVAEAADTAAETVEAPEEPAPEPAPTVLTEMVESAPPVVAPQPSTSWSWGAASSRTSTTTVRPQTLITIGVALFLGSCLWTMLAAVSPLPRGLAFCLGPIGIVVIIVGVVMQATARPTRRF